MFSAAYNSKGKIALVISMGAGGLFHLVTSAYAREEARRNLERKFPDRLPQFSQHRQSIRLVADNPSLPCPASLADKGWPICRAAKACKADVLLTSDRRHFGFLMHVPELSGGLLIKPVADCLEMFS